MTFEVGEVVHCPTGILTILAVENAHELEQLRRYTVARPDGIVIENYPGYLLKSSRTKIALTLVNGSTLEFEENGEQPYVSADGWD